MKNRFLKILALLLVWCALASVPNQLLAQSTNKAPVPKKAAKDGAAKKPSAHPFHGTLTAIDKNAKTITVGKVTYQTSSETKFKKGDKPATLEEGVIGEEVGGYVKPNEEGKLVASSVRFGPKSDAIPAGQKKEPEKKK